MRLGDENSYWTVLFHVAFGALPPFGICSDPSRHLSCRNQWLYAPISVLFVLIMAWYDSLEALGQAKLLFSGWFLNSCTY